MAQLPDSLISNLQDQPQKFVDDWLAEARKASGGAPFGETTAADARVLLEALRTGMRAGGDPESLDAPAWNALRDRLAELSASRAAQGATAADTSIFVLSMKKPMFAALQAAGRADPAALVESLWSVTTLVDKLAQFTVSTYQRSREGIISRQQQELLELSTPVVKLWDGVLAVPMIGTLDSNRTQIVMETLLQGIVQSGAEIAIIDITGVPTVDTLVAQHLLKTVTAIRLMGADCIISGIRPQIAQTIVHLGIDLQGITTKATLADALSLALKRSGFTISRTKA
jgi:rsbT co-antagonist protein RsbR